MTQRKGKQKEKYMTVKRGPSGPIIQQHQHDIIINMHYVSFHYIQIQLNDFKCICSLYYIQGNHEQLSWFTSKLEVNSTSNILFQPPYTPDSIYYHDYYKKIHLIIFVPNQQKKPQSFYKAIYLKKKKKILNG